MDEGRSAYGKTTGGLSEGVQVFIQRVVEPLMGSESMCQSHLDPAAVVEMSLGSDRYPISRLEIEFGLRDSLPNHPEGDIALIHLTLYRSKKSAWIFSSST